jgi:hypothetical protein
MAFDKKAESRCSGTVVLATLLCGVVDAPEGSG